MPSACGSERLTMCGVAGYFGVGQLEPEAVHVLLDRMRHRGPDHQAHGMWPASRGHNCFLFHSRLSIIDLDPRANQPFTVGTKSIVFNGELYNYRELRLGLRNKGYEFRTESDTEVMLAAIAHYGWAVLDRFEGMWALAVYDRHDESLTLCRDRFGEKPLYVYRDRKGLYFASEVKFIQELQDRPLEINIDQLYRYLVNGYRSLYKHGGETFFKDVTEVAPGTIFRLDAAGGTSCDRYWRPACHIDEAMTHDDAVAGVRQKLIRSLDLRLRSDVPIAFCMSGGVDSNSLISIAKNLFEYDVHGFTIVNTDQRYEEQDAVEQSVKELGIRHTNVALDRTDFLGRVRSLVRQHDAPIFTISYFAHWLLMRAVSESGYRVSVSGTAADELFTGYLDHHLLYFAEVADDPALFARSRDAWERTVKPNVRNPYLQDAATFVERPDFRDHLYLNAERFSSYTTRDWHEAFTETNFTDGLLRNRMLNELFHEVIPVILHEDDVNAMSFSIENRSPFLDRQLFDYCYSIPTRHLMRDGYAKVVLRDAMRGIVPSAVLDNSRKVGFNVPLSSFVDFNDRQTREAVLDDGPVFDLVRRDSIGKMWDQPSLANSESKFLFNFICLRMFMEEFGQAGTGVAV